MRRQDGKRTYRRAVAQNANGGVRLKKEQSDDIAGILRDEFHITPYRRAAIRLMVFGITSKHLHAFGRTAQGRITPSIQTCNVYNEMTRLERATK